MKKDGVNLVVIIEPNATNDKDEKVNMVVSIYDKDNSNEILRWIGENKILEYTDPDKKRILS